MFTKDAALQRVKGIKESFDNGVQNKFTEYMDNRVFDYYNTTEVFEIFTSTEGLEGTKQLAEYEAPPVLTLEDGYTITIEEQRFGGGILLPEKIYKREGNDVSMKVDAYLMRQRDQLMKDTVDYFLTENFLILNEAFSATATYLAPDAAPLCAISGTANHEWASGDTFNNGVTTALSQDAIDTAMEYAGAFQSPGGKPSPLNFDTIIVKKGSANSRVAKKLFAYGITPTAVNDINIYEGSMTIIETPYITYTNRAYWFLLDTSMDNAAKVGVGIFPTMNDPIVQNNEAILSNVTGFFKQGVVNMPSMWYGSDGTA
jgi:hypothetical protein